MADAKVHSYMLSGDTHRLGRPLCSSTPLHIVSVTHLATAVSRAFASGVAMHGHEGRVCHTYRQLKRALGEGDIGVKTPGRGGGPRDDDVDSLVLRV